MRHLSVSEFEKRFDEIIVEVIKGETMTITITDDNTGEPIAEFVPVKDSD